MIGVQHRIATAIQKGKKTITINKKKINLPSPQRCGTFTQQATYADQKARQIIEDMGID